MNVPPRAPPAIDNSMLLAEEEPVNRDYEEDDGRENDNRDSDEDGDDMGVQEEDGPNESLRGWAKDKTKALRRGGCFGPRRPTGLKEKDGGFE